MIALPVSAKERKQRQNKAKLQVKQRPAKKSHKTWDKDEERFLFQLVEAETKPDVRLVGTGLYCTCTQCTSIYRTDA